MLNMFVDFFEKIEESMYEFCWTTEEQFLPSSQDFKDRTEGQSDN